MRSRVRSRRTGAERHDCTQEVRDDDRDDRGGGDGAVRVAVENEGGEVNDMIVSPRLPRDGSS
jgi:hypothetical protein